MDNAYASSIAPSYGTGEQAISQTLTGELRVTMSSGGSPASVANPFPVSVQGVYGVVALVDNTTAAVGNSVLISATAAGTVTLTMADASTVVVNPQVGDNIYPFQITKAHVTSGTITAMYNLYMA